MGSATVNAEMILTKIDLQPILTSVHIVRMPAPSMAGLIAEAIEDPDQANMYMRMFHLLQALGQRELALDFEEKALALRRVYRTAGTTRPAIRLLALMGPGGMRNNTPLDFIVENSDIRLDLLFLSPDQSLPNVIPDHDVAIIALNEAEKNGPLLACADKWLSIWPRPVLNRPEHILRCARHATWTLLNDIPGLKIPKTERVMRDRTTDLPFPVTIRPIDTHAGEGLEKLDAAGQLSAYYTAHPESEFYLAEYIDYRSRDGLFRKYRIALIDGKPFLCHLAISDHWIVHYVSASMSSSREKRNEESAAMESFDHDFASRHADALQAIARRLDLDYVVLDCGEMPDGRLLFFEADVAGWIHAIDATGPFSYKLDNMQKAFSAFRQLLVRKMA